MKDFKSILIGILGTTCVFLFLGTTSVKDNGYKWDFVRYSDGGGVLLNKEEGQLYRFVGRKLLKVNSPDSAKDLD